MKQQQLWLHTYKVHEERTLSQLELERIALNEGAIASGEDSAKTSIAFPTEVVLDHESWLVGLMCALETRVNWDPSN